MRLARVRQIHDRLRPELERDIDLFPFLGHVGEIPRYAQVDVHLRSQTDPVDARADPLGAQRFMMDVGRYGDATDRNGLANLLRITPLLGSDDTHRLGDYACTGEIDLRHRRTARPVRRADNGAPLRAIRLIRCHENSLRWHYPYQVPRVEAERRPLSARPAVHAASRAPRMSITRGAVYTAPDEQWITAA